MINLYKNLNEFRILVDSLKSYYILKSRKIQLQIEEPCRVKQERLTKMTGGYYCDLCNKCVGDYTSYSDRQIYETFGAKEQKDLCGIFRPEQLSKVYQDKTNASRGFFSSLIVSGFLLVSRNSYAQSENKADSTFTNETITADTSSVSDSIQVRKPVTEDTLSVSLDLEEEGEVVKHLSMDTTIFVTYGFIQMKEVPSYLPFQNLIDSAKKAGAVILIGLGVKKKTQDGPPAKSPLRNSDKPVWLQSLRNRFRRKKKNS